MENHAKYGDSIYFHDDDSLYVNLFIPSTVNWHAKGVRLTQTTSFPSDRSTAFVLRLDRPTQFTLRLRQPSWSRQSEVSINGARSMHRTPGTYLELKRTWRDGDRIEMFLTKGASASEDEFHKDVIR